MLERGWLWGSALRPAAHFLPLGGAVYFGQAKAMHPQRFAWQLSC